MGGGGESATTGEDAFLTGDGEEVTCGGGDVAFGGGDVGFGGGDSVFCGGDGAFGGGDGDKSNLDEGVGGLGGSWISPRLGTTSTNGSLPPEKMHYQMSFRHQSKKRVD
ncbi:uncharacterized protein [Solanum lycopersicum]|uniref:uncharacterized protein n=1 Tax=Solanum lycopersicum TaxID=4081 RepID=UPI003747CC05